MKAENAALLHEPENRRQIETTAGFTMNWRRKILWQCNKSKGVGLFRRLNGKVLNHVQSGRYAVCGFNTGRRMEVGDTHALDDLPNWKIQVQSL